MTIFTSHAFFTKNQRNLDFCSRFSPFLIGYRRFIPVCLSICLISVGFIYVSFGDKDDLHISLYLLFFIQYKVRLQEIPQYHFRDLLFFAIFLRESQYSFVTYLYVSQFPVTVFHLLEFFSRVSSRFLIIFSYSILETF